VLPNIQSRVRHRLRISIIVPVYNEAELVAGLVARLAALDAWQVIVVDGGSNDGSGEYLASHCPAPVMLCRSEAGRARQMNEGALRASGELLLFLHADTVLPEDGLEKVQAGLERHPERRWGRFDARFDHAGPALQLVARAMSLRSAWTGICTGDQALFVYRREFLALGGFAPVPLMEDVELSRRLKRISRPLRVRLPVTTSSRRWLEHGVWSTIFLMWRLRWLYWRGVPARVLATRYHDKSS